MVMSQGTYTFLTCFAGFWLIWGLIVLLCCFCSYLRRRMKRQQEERLREQSLRTLELEPLHYEGYAGSPPGIAIPHRLRVEPHHPPHSSPAALELPARVGPVEAAVLRGGAADGGAAPAVQRGAHGHAGALPQDQRPLPEPRAAGEAGAAPQLQAPLPGHGLRLGAAPAPRRQPGAGLPGPLPAGRVLPAHVPQLDGLGAQQQGRLRAGALAPPRLHAPLRQDYGRVGGGSRGGRPPPPTPTPPQLRGRAPTGRGRRASASRFSRECQIQPPLPPTPTPASRDGPGAPARAAASARGAGSPPGPLPRGWGARSWARTLLCFLSCLLRFENKSLWTRLASRPGWRRGPPGPPPSPHAGGSPLGSRFIY